MEEQKAKRTRRTPEQMIEEIEAKMQKLTQEIEAIEEKRMATNQEFDQKVEAVKGKIAAMEQRKRNPCSQASPETPQNKETKDCGDCEAGAEVWHEAGADCRGFGREYRGLKIIQNPGDKGSISSGMLPLSLI